MRKERAKLPPDAPIAHVAANQHGVVTVAQLYSAGLSPAGITRRLESGRLHRIHRGVYAVGHDRLSDEGRWMAAVLACGEGAVLSHLSAADLWGIRRRRRSGAGGRVGAVHVTVAGTAGRRQRGGIVLHRSSTLNASDCTRHDGIPVTKPARTLADLRPLLSPAQFNAAVREAEFLGLPISDPFGGPDGGDGGSFEIDRARTELEQRLLGLCRRHRLPQPEVNTRLDRYEVDFLWRAQHLAVEVDGWDSHRTRSAFEEDRARDAHLSVLGFQVVRFTWRQISKDASAVAKTIRSLLQAR
jgi:very-short-patch-repair endonuclease